MTRLSRDACTADLPMGLQAWFLRCLGEGQGGSINGNLDLTGSVWEGYFGGIAASEQVMWVRDRLPEFWYKKFGYEKAGDLYNHVKVISTHTSKSCLLPVYEMRLADDLTVVARCNFHDWKVSVESGAYPVDFGTTYYPPMSGDDLSPCYFEGFPPSRIYPAFTGTQTKWSASLSADRESFYLFLWLLVRAHAHSG